ncbi:MAG: hypothetical protein WAU17_05440 [Nitrospirales bacterium]
MKVASCELRIASCELRVAVCGLPSIFIIGCAQAGVDNCPEKGLYTRIKENTD